MNPNKLLHFQVSFDVVVHFTYFDLRLTLFITYFIIVLWLGFAKVPLDQAVTPPEFQSDLCL